MKTYNRVANTHLGLTQAAGLENQLQVAGSKKKKKKKHCICLFMQNDQHRRHPRVLMFEHWKTLWRSAGDERQKNIDFVIYLTTKTEEQKMKNKLKSNMASNKIISTKAPNRFDELYQFAFADGLTLSWAAQQLRSAWDNCTQRDRGALLNR